MKRDEIEEVGSPQPKHCQCAVAQLQTDNCQNGQCTRFSSDPVKKPRRINPEKASDRV